MEWITIEELAAYLQRTIPADDPSALLIVELANGLVTDLIGADAEESTEIRVITLTVAARAYRNPDGSTSVTRSFDDASKTTRWESEGSSGSGVFLTDAERSRLLLLAGKTIPARSIQLKVC